MPNAELQDELVWVLQARQYRDGRSQKEKQKGSKAIVALNFRIWKLAKSLAALAGFGSITRIKP